MTSPTAPSAGPSAGPSAAPSGSPPAVGPPAVAGPVRHPGYEPRRAYRDARTPVLGGVAGGLAEHLAVPVLWVRAAFVALAAIGGMGIAAYAGLWMFLPAGDPFDHAAPGLESASRGGRRPGRVRRLADVGPAVVLGMLALGAVLVFHVVFGGSSLFWPVVIGLAGIALLWRQADEAQRERWLDQSGRISPYRVVFGDGGLASYLRVSVGLLLVVGALVLVGIGDGGLAAAGSAALAGVLGLVGLAIVAGPWAVRLVDDLGAERAERVRTQERADLAAHLHDSVLQTLALIQNNADDAALVARLARSQERELRAWLFEENVADDTTVVGALRRSAAQVEEVHDIVVDVVGVGDCPLTERLRPLTDAAGEAIVNAAKHARTDRVDVYAEIEPDAVEVFVRDRGVGFDPEQVAADRRGISSSITGRMERHGGTARIRSAPGEGTEVRLRMPRQEDSDG